jgi:Uma2 family endonuclease
MCALPLRGSRAGVTVRAMAPQAGSIGAPGPYRWEDFLSLDEDDLRELIDGHLLELEVPTKIHEWIVTWLVMCLNGWALPRNAGVALVSGYKVRIRDDRGVMPDVQFFRRGGRPLPDRGLDRGAPDLAIEVVSPSSKRWDRVVKLAWYASIGTPEYWIVEPRRKTVERYLLASDGTLRLDATCRDADVFEPASLPGLEIDCARLWTMPEV